MAQVLEGKLIAERLKYTLHKERERWGSVALAALKVKGEEIGDVYVRAQKRLAKELNVEYRLFEVEKEDNGQRLIALISQLNKDKIVKGIIVHRPLPPNYKEEEIFSSIDIKKDIEGMHPYNQGRIVLGQPMFISPTVLSILEFIHQAKVKLYGEEVVIVGASSLVGKPLSLILLDKFSTVTVTHIATYQRGHLPFYVRRADILISCVGKPEVIKGEWIKQGSLVIDVGISKQGGKIKGDVEFEEARKRANFITPVPGGVGVLTTVFLFLNLLKAAKLWKD